MTPTWFPAWIEIWAAPLVLAAGSVVAAALITPTAWIDFVAYPPFEGDVPETTRRGAVLLRIALFSLPAVLALLAIVNQVSVRASGRNGDERKRSAGETEAAARSDGVSPSRDSRAPAAILLIIIAVAFLLRALRMGESLWYDEIAAWMTFGRYGPGPIVGNLFDPANHIAHTLLTALSVEIAGNALSNEITLRLPALIFSLLTIPGVFLLGREAINQRAGLAGAFLAAVLPVFVLEGVEARGYSMMICASALATWLFLRGLRTQSPINWFAYAIVCALGVWAHMLTAFVAIGHAVWLLGAIAWLFIARDATRRDAARPNRVTMLQAAGAIILAGALSLVVYAPVIPDLLDIGETFGRTNPTQPSILGIEGRHALLQLGGSWAWWAAVPGIVLSVTGIVVAFRRSGAREGNDQESSANTQARIARRAIFLSLLGFPCAIVIALVLDIWLYARFLLFVMPGAVLAMMVALDWLIQRSRASGFIACGLILCLSCADLFTRPPRQPLREAFGHVVDDRQPGDRLGVVGLFHGVFELYAPPDMRTAFTTHAAGDMPDMIERFQPDWVVIYYPHLLTDATRNALTRNGFTLDITLPGWADWGRGHVRVYRRRD